MSIDNPFIRKESLEFAGRNLTLNLNTPPLSLTNWDSGLWRGPRVLVPIHVEALVVDDEENGPWADMRLTPEGIPGYLEERDGEEVETSDLPQRPSPFDTMDSPRTPGVYLHWALPDALTQGRVNQTTDEAPPTMEDVGKPPQPEPESTEDVEFPYVPDRWLVIRTSPGNTATAKRRMSAWVIESESPQETAVTGWYQWEEDRSDNPPERWLTAVGEGDPAYMAYFDNAEGKLGFHDDLSGVERGPLTYTVIGWYSYRQHDPLYAPQSTDEFSALLASYRWSVQGDEDRLEAAALAAREYARQIALDYQVVARSPYLLRTITDASKILVEDDIEIIGFTGATPLAETALRANINAVRASTQFNAQASVDASETYGAGFHTAAEIARIAQEAALGVETRDNLFLRYYPRQMLCHGTVFDVEWNGFGGTYDPGDSGIPQAGSIKVAVGNTPMEALAAALAERSERRNFQRLLTAYHYGVLATIGDQDGIALLESLLHAEDFASRPGGYVVDTIEAGDLFNKRTPAERYAVQNPAKFKAVEQDVAQNPAFLEARRRNQIITLDSELNDNKASFDGTGRYTVNMRYVKDVFEARGGDMRDLLRDVYVIDGVKDNLRDVNKPTRKTVPIRRALPRYWEPKDPSVLLIEARRSYKHGEDGRHNEDGTLACRITGEVVNTVTVNMSLDNPRLSGFDLCGIMLLSGQIPPEASVLFSEALLLDTSNSRLAVRALETKNNGGMERIQAMVRLSKNGNVLAPNTAYEWLVTQHWNLYTNPALDAQALLADVEHNEGAILPSLIAMRPWRKPWTPLHLEWEVDYFESPNLHHDWRLGENEYVYTGDTFPTPETAPDATYTGRTLLTPAVARVVAQNLEKFLDDERNDVSDQATDAQEDSLADLLDALNRMDTLGTTLSEFHDLMMGIENPYRFNATDIIDPVDDTTDDPTDDENPIFSVRAGHLRIKRLRVVDAFGQIYDVDQDSLNTMHRAEDVEPDNTDDGTLVQLPPRVNQPARAMFRLLSATDDSVEATKSVAPVCGWILPDHLDEALEVYNQQGISQGQLQLAPDGKHIEWFGVPGKPAPLGAPPNLQNPHLRGFVDAMLGWGVRDQDAMDNPDADTPKESALSALLRMIDATLWTVDPVGREGDEHLSVLVGRPLAVVRAELRFELEGNPLTDELSRMAFPCRLGAVTHQTDGLMGYFLNDDYTTFYPVHETIAAQTRPSGPNSGFLGPIEQIPDYYNDFGQSGDDEDSIPVVDAVDHPYINLDPVIYLRPQQKIRLTLLLDPRGGVHFTAGLLPRKRIDLMREHVATALENITVTFSVGPVLTNPEDIKMPLPSEIRGKWNWVHRTGPTIWQEDDVTPATEDALLSDKPTEINEGWLKLSGAYVEDDEDASP